MMRNDTSDQPAGRLEYIDAMKAIGVICVVIHHAGLGGVIRTFIYPFEVAAFMFVSGLLFNEKHINTKEKLRLYIINKLKKLWIPLVFWNSILIFFNNIFLKVGIYSSNPDVLKINPSYIFLDKYLTVKETMIEIFRVVTLQDTAHISGGAWFLRALLAMSIIYAVSCYIILLLSKKVDYLNSLRVDCKVVMVALGIFIEIIVTFFNSINGLPYQITMMGDYFLLYSIGALLSVLLFEKIQKTPLVYRISLFFICLIVMLVYCFQDELGIVSIVGTFIRILAGISSVIIGYFIYKIIRKVDIVKQCVLYVGRHTLPIVILHGFGFKIVCFIQVKVYGCSNLYLAAGPIVENPLWLLVTIIFGIAIPLIIAKVIKIVESITGIMLLRFVC